MKTSEWAGGGTCLLSGHSRCSEPGLWLCPSAQRPHARISISGAALRSGRESRARAQISAILGRTLREAAGGGAHGHGLCRGSPRPPPCRWYRPAVVRPGRAAPALGDRADPVLVGLARASFSYNLAGVLTPRPFHGAGLTMAVGKNKRLTKGGKKGAKKKV